MQKIFNNKVIAILGLISSIYVIAFLVLLLFSTMTLLNVATLFYIMMWVDLEKTETGQGRELPF